MVDMAIEICIHIHVQILLGSKPTGCLIFTLLLFLMIGFFFASFWSIMPQFDF